MLPSRPGLIGPGAGRLIAEMVMGAPPLVNPTPFRLSRFTDGSNAKPHPLASFSRQNLNASCRSHVRVGSFLILMTYFAAVGNAGSLSRSRASCWMMTVALEFAAIFLTRSREASVWARSVLNAGTPLLS
jgi:hypothetical protein